MPGVYLNLSKLPHQFQPNFATLSGWSKHMQQWTDSDDQYIRPRQRTATHLKLDKSPYLSSGLTDQHVLWQDDAM